MCSVTQSCPTLCDPMNYSLPGSSVHGILQARIREWVAMPSSTQGSKRGLQHWRQILYHLSHQENPLPGALPIPWISLRTLINTSKSPSGFNFVNIPCSPWSMVIHGLAKLYLLLFPSVISSLTPRSANHWERSWGDYAIHGAMVHACYGSQIQHSTWNLSWEEPC